MDPLGSRCDWTTSDVPWVGPPPTTSGILGKYKDLNIIAIPLVVTITGWGPNLTYTGVGGGESARAG